MNNSEPSYLNKFPYAKIRDSQREAIDFAIDTPIGTAVDRINEVLKALAPAPAPSLDDINSLQTGQSLFLSLKQEQV